jgi:RNA polymerase sigma-70 factor (ECF subfamily)
VTVRQAGRTGGTGDEPTDRELVDRHLGGDRVAFAVLVRRHERKVYNLAYRVLGREEDARDASQDAFLTVLRKLSQYRGDAAFSTWLHRITVNSCYDLLRKRKREPMLDTSEDAHTMLRVAPGDHAESTAVSVDVQRGLQAVSQEFRVALVMHDLQDISYEDISEALELPVGTVKSRIHRGRVAFARAMGAVDEHGEHEDPERGERSGPSRPSEKRTFP